MADVNFSEETVLSYIPDSVVYDVWNVSEDMNFATRMSIDGKMEEKIPLTADVLKIVKKQEVAFQHLTNFLSLPLESEDTNYFIYDIMNHHLNYLSRDALNMFLDRIHFIIQSSMIDFERESYLNLFRDYVIRRIQGTRIDEETEELFELVVQKFGTEMLKQTKGQKK